MKKIEKKRPLVSVVIATYNRFEGLLMAIQSVKAQTYSDIEIIVINDKSDDPKYYNKSLRPKGIIWIDLEESSREKFGFPCFGYVKNIGIEKMTGEYYASLDDDDYWFPEKINSQINLMLQKNCSFSTTDGLLGFGIYNAQTKYISMRKHYNRDHYRRKYTKKDGVILGRLPELLNYNMIKDECLIIHSSVILKKSLLDSVGGKYMEIKLGGEMINGQFEVEDFSLWKKILSQNKSKVLYIDTPLLYYQLRETLEHKKACKKAFRKKWKYDIMDFIYPFARFLHGITCV